MKGRKTEMRVRVSEDRIPVIVGIGEVKDRPDDPMDGLEPLALMAAALDRAHQDAGGGVLAAVDSLDVVNLTSWRYADPARQLACRLGITPARAVYGAIGGESPVRFLHEAALRIARGESAAVAIVGAEAQHTVNQAQKAKLTLPWTEFARDAPVPLRGADFLHPLAVKLGVAQPISVYPFYDAASAAHWGQTPREALMESGDLWSVYSRVAETNPFAWLPKPYASDDIVTPTADNRLIAWPYTKRMVANPTVNQGAAILVTSLARARAARIPDGALVHIWGGAAANEPRDYLDRDQFHESHAQDAVLDAATAIASGDAFDALELYSCFPCVPKMARRALGLGPDVQPTVTGGLSFFGAPLNNYMTHAACAMVRRLRIANGVGLLYGQGEFVTKHHALVLSSSPSRKPITGWPSSVQDMADSRRGPVPPFRANVAGPCRLETFTILYGRDGSVSHAVVILRGPGGTRGMARVPAGDERTLARLTDLDVSPVGIDGVAVPAVDGIPNWRALP
ncbi:acetyl-CoA acetyltransferase [Azospirillum sp. CT11-132]|uniref:acetyl-CoA acetyltransferase n=1 Tax=Azospirillum sp. CT11-132 TaxID=3396317 RepID=UPI0039A60B4D